MSALVETSVDGQVALCRLNRPEARNALSPELMEELAAEVERFDADPEIRCLVIAGSDEVFAAGADIGALRERTFEESLRHPARAFWGRLAACRTPMIAAVSGFALGGGCELALLCDLIVASETAEFGQPEITLGIIPGGGGTQRLARVIGKQRAMELVLTGRRIDAGEAARLGIVNEVAAAGEWLDRALELAQRIARRPPIAARLAKQAVLAADETTLSAGLEHERRLYELAMATEDRIEGMDAFLEKRKPQFKGTVRVANVFEPRLRSRGGSAGLHIPARENRLASGQRAAGREPLRAAAGPSELPVPLAPANEELLIVLSGPASLRSPLGGGNFPRGRWSRFGREGGAHQIVNRGRDPGDSSCSAR